MTERPKWERVADDTERLPVRGGWLYQVRVSSTSNSSVALCFVPDAKARHMRELTRANYAALEPIFTGLKLVIAQHQAEHATADPPRQARLV